MPVARWFNKTASVFVESDDFQAAVKTDLACGLFHYAIDGSSTGSDRAELMAARLLMWDPAYNMPEGSQVEIEGNRWQTPRGGYALIMHRNTNTPAYRRAHVLRAV
jgi:hypothetical protein